METILPLFIELIGPTIILPLAMAGVSLYFAYKCFIPFLTNKTKDFMDEKCNEKCPQEIKKHLDRLKESIIIELAKSTEIEVEKEVKKRLSGIATTKDIYKEIMEYSSKMATKEDLQRLEDRLNAFIIHYQSQGNNVSKPSAGKEGLERKV